MKSKQFQGLLLCSLCFIVNLLIRDFGRKNLLMKFGLLVENWIALIQLETFLLIFSHSIDCCLSPYLALSLSLSLSPSFHLYCAFIGNVNI